MEETFKKVKFDEEEDGKKDDLKGCSNCVNEDEKIISWCDILMNDFLDHISNIDDNSIALDANVSIMFGIKLKRAMLFM